MIYAKNAQLGSCYKSWRTIQNPTKNRIIKLQVNPKQKVPGSFRISRSLFWTSKKLLQYRCHCQYWVDNSYLSSSKYAFWGKTSLLSATSKTEKKRDFRENCTFTGPYEQFFHEKAYGQHTARFSLGRQPFKVKRFEPEGNI